MARPFEKGNPGRPKGALNHSSRIREDFFEIWHQVDGKTKLAEYVSHNPKALFQFAELIVKLLPSEQRDPVLPGPAPKFIFYLNGAPKEVTADDLANGRLQASMQPEPGQNGTNGHVPDA